MFLGFVQEPLDLACGSWEEQDWPFFAGFPGKASRNLSCLAKQKQEGYFPPEVLSKLCPWGKASVLFFFFPARGKKMELFPWLGIALAEARVSSFLELVSCNNEEGIRVSFFCRCHVERESSLLQNWHLKFPCNSGRF